MMLTQIEIQSLDQKLPLLFFPRGEQQSLDNRVINLRLLKEENLIPTTWVDLKKSKKNVATHQNSFLMGSLHNATTKMGSKG
jgi:hypothetical protein